MGGNKGRKQGKKYQAAPAHNLRLASEEAELYAVFTKLFGGSSTEVMCSDGVSRKCIIRNKFRGRHRRDNRVEVGVLALVGVREWESASHQSVDLLHVYSPEHRQRLVGEVAADWTWLTGGEDGNATASSIEFQSVIPASEKADELPAPDIVCSEDAINVDDI